MNRGATHLKATKGPLPTVFLVGWLSCVSVEAKPGRKSPLAALFGAIAATPKLAFARLDKAGEGDSEGACGSTDFDDESAAPQDGERLTLPKSGIVKVAFVVSDRATLIDIVGPMQTFDQVQVPDGGFETFTVSELRKPIKVGTLTITPDHTFADAPDPDIVVVGAQSGDNENYLGYLRRMNSSGKLMLSVCTGASKFAMAGLLDGRMQPRITISSNSSRSGFRTCASSPTGPGCVAARQFSLLAAKHPASNWRYTSPSSTTITPRP